MIKRIVAGVGAGLLMLTPALAMFPSAASASEGTLVANTSSTWQTDGTVFSLAYANGNVYATGTFSNARPPGVAKGGSGTVARQYMAAFSASNGSLTSFKHTFDAAPKMVVASPDQKRVYVVGPFKTVDGTAHRGIVAFNTATGNIDTTFANQAPDYTVNAVAVSPDSGTVYIGGGFSHVGSANRVRFAAYSASGTLLPWNPTADNIPYAMAATASTVYIGGTFTQLNGDTTYHNMGAVSATTGQNLSFPAVSAIPVPSSSCVSTPKDIVVSGDSLYVADEGTGGGCFDGTFAANLSDNTLKWQNQCLGATQAIQVVGGYLYKGSHAHDCQSANNNGDPNNFPQVPTNQPRHLLAENLSNGYLAPWYPDMNGGADLGPRAMATDGTHLWVGGDFTVINNQSQQGFTEFGPGPDLIGPSRPAAPSAVAAGNGAVNVYVQAPVDADDPDLTVRLYRDGGSTPVATANVNSLFWRQPIVGLRDTGLAAGSKHTYRVDAIEQNGSNSPNGGNVSPVSASSASVTVDAGNGTYASTVAGDNPSLFWRLGESAGASIAADSSANLYAGAYSSTGVTLGQPGAINGDSNTAASFDGSAGNVVGGNAVDSPATFSTEAWFKTTTTSGGKIIGFGSSATGNSSNYDKHVYMTNGGQIVFGVYNGNTTTIGSSAAYNDGQWHQVIATQGASGMALYIDGNRVATGGATTNQSFSGYWRVGGDNLNGWPAQPSSAYFAGTIDDVAVYPAALSQKQVTAHYVASGRTSTGPAAPTDAYGKAVYDSNPDSFWRLNEATGPTAADAAGNGNTAAYGSGVGYGSTGAVANGSSVTLDGTSNGSVTSNQQINGPSTYSVEMWFKTTSTSGGKLIGFGNDNTGNSGNYDRHVYMTNDGRLVFGTYNGETDIAETTGAYNDGGWHYMVATQGANGMSLYVDDQLVATNAATTAQSYSGYWRVGGDTLNGWPDQPSNQNFTGSVDEVAIYPVALTANDIQAHWTAAGH